MTRETAQAPKTRRPRGQGSVFYLPKRGWVGLVEWPRQDGRLRRRVTAQHKTRDAASAWVLEKLRQRDAGLEPYLTVSALLGRWLGSLDVRPTTRKRYEELCRLHVLPRVGHLRVANLLPQDIEGLMAAMLEAGQSRRSAMHARAVLRMALNAARRWGLAERNVASLAKALQVFPRELQPLSPAEARGVLAAVRGDRLEALFVLSLALGLRQGEGLGLRWADLDEERAVLSIQRTLVRCAGAWSFGPPRCRNSLRALDLPRQVTAALGRHRARQLQEREQAGARWQGERWGHLIFADEVGAPVSCYHVGRRFKVLIAAAGLRPLHYSDLRPAAAALMAGRGVPIYSIMGLLGHGRISTTMEVCRRVVPDLVKEASETMAAILWEPGETEGPGRTPPGPGG